MSETNPTPRGQAVKSLSRSTLVMRVLADRPMRPAELSRELDKPWATIYRTIRVLTEEGMLQRDPDTGEYSIGPMMWAMATSYLRDHPVLGVGLGHLEQALPHVPGLLKVTERSGSNAVTLFAEQNPQAGAVTRIREQYRLPLHCASFGLVLLAHAPDEVVEEYLAGPLTAVSPRTITDPQDLRTRIAEVRDQGHAASRAELQDDNGSLSVPIRRKDGAVVAALTAVLPLPVFDDDADRSLHLERLSDTATRISEALGWRGTYA